jgi:Kef-type K+ transport system membrane component KefB
MRDLQSARVIWLKGALFVVMGMLAAGTLLLEHPDWKVAILLALAIWAFARAYYFAFYVIEHYVDRQYKFAGLFHFFRYSLARRRKEDTRTKTEG